MQRPCQCYLLEEFHDVDVHHFVSVQACLIAQRGSEACDGGLVHTAAHVIVEAFQRCAVAEPGVLHEPWVAALRLVVQLGAST